MSDYGSYTTQYAKLSNEELYGMYRESVFSNLSNGQKLDLGQETVNRDAAERGMKGAPKLVFAELPEGIKGQNLNGTIEIDNNVLNNNCEFLNTVIHENIHSYQDQVIDGTITEVDENIALQYKANANNIGSAVFHEGTYQMGSHYLRGISSTDCSVVQATERDAMKGAEAKTSGIIQALAEKYGMEPSFQNYENSISENGYLVWENRAIERFQNPNFEKDVNQVLLNQYFGDDVIVDSNTEKAVKAEMIVSYEAVLNNEATTNLVSAGGKNMGVNEVAVENEQEVQCTGMMPEVGMEAIGFTIEEMPEMDSGSEIENDLDDDLEL